VFQRPNQVISQRTLFSGITYQREFHRAPQPYWLHIVRVDLTAPGLRTFVTPGAPGRDNREISARTTSEFLREFGLQLAVNGSYFFPIVERNPWDYYPHSGDRISIVGQVISNGVTYSSAEPDWATICFFTARAEIHASGRCPRGTQQAIAGSTILVAASKPVPLTQSHFADNRPYPRTVVALDQPGKTLWLVLVDGKQPGYSMGVTIAELVAILQQLGVYTALALDGGGSTTLVMATASGAKTLNAPIQTHVPMRQRPIATHLGFYALPNGVIK
jgi:exopolysaccharide biosynthesis protein